MKAPICIGFHLLIIVIINEVSSQKNLPPTFTETLEDIIGFRGLPEDTPVGTTIGYLKATDPEGLPITYGMESDTYDCVDPKTGLVILTRRLDRETNTQTRVVVTAEDSTGTTFSKTNKISYEYEAVILDINDNNPVFHNAPYQTEVEENAAIGSTIYNRISVTDIDRGLNAEILLLCMGTTSKMKEACNFFGVQEQRVTEGVYTGSVVVRKALDYETNRDFILHIVARDYGRQVQLNTSVNMIIEVKDVQDSQPRFLNAPISIFTTENKPVNSRLGVIQAVDQDGTPRNLSIQLINDANGFFRIGSNISRDPNTGIHTADIILNKPLDREVKDFHTVRFKATELLANGQPTNDVTFADGRIVVNDINDQPPKFSKTNLQLSIREGLRQGTTLSLMDVKDFDIGDNSKFTIRLVNNTYGTYVVLPTEGTGSTALNLQVLRPETLDYEVVKYRQQILKVIARESTAPNTESTATVTILLTDVNDNRPKFDEQNYTVSVSETRKVGYKVIKVHATDDDSGIFGEITYSLEGDNSQEFNINSTTGEIFLAKKLDYEESRHIDVLVQAVDGAGKRTTSKLRVNVLDHNDLAPEFTLDQYVTYLREKSTTFETPVILQAIDKEQSRVTYRIKSGNTPDNAFQVNPSTGAFSVKRGLSYQEAPSGGKFRVIVEASDNGLPPQTSEVPVIVTMLDVNDNAPIFGKTIYSKQISEITPAGARSSILTVTATDADAGMNGEITYRIVSGSQDNFAIDYRTGIIKVSNNGNLDIDRYGTEYSMLVVAEDKGSPQLSGNCTVRITVTNANNKLPVFPRDTYLVNLADNAAAGTAVVKTEAIDPDGALAGLQYRIPIDSYEFKRADGQIISNSNLRTQLTIDSLDGSVTTLTALKPEQTKQFSFKVIAQDIRAQDPIDQRATATVLVSLFRPTGDYPFFNSPWTLANPVITINMPEEEPISPVPTLVTTLVARDPKTNEKLTNYRVIPGSNSQGYFRLDPLNGHVYLNKRVDYDTLSKKSIGFEVEVSTVRTPVKTSKAFINLQVQDLNDNNPQFYSPNGYTFEVSETRRFPAQVGQVFASDLDSGSYGTIRYSLSGSGHQTFSIDSTIGRIFIAAGAVLDYEQTRVYNLRATATDNPTATGNRRETSVPVTIRVLDFNDVTPHFEEPKYVMHTLETVKAQTSIGRVLALDEDGGMNGQITYFIYHGNDKNMFAIDMNSGIISARIDLLGRARNVPYTLTVRGQDQGSPRLFSDVQVQIFVDDLQAFDGRPRFSHPYVGESVWIPEEERIGYPVTRIQAYDTDGPNTDIRYRFLNNGNKDHDKFTIDPITGNITTTQVLDREVQAVYQLMVFITDGSNPQKSNQMHFFVKLLDKNDQIPTFEFCGWEVVDPLRSSVMENRPRLTYVTKVKGCDTDVYPNNIVYYHITCGNAGGYFTIEKSTGVIQTTKPIDRELTPEFTLCVRITNNSTYTPGVGDYRRKKRAILRDHALIHVYILILDEDDNGPGYSYRNKQFTAGILMTAPRGSPVISVDSYDPDTPIYNITYYRILSQEFHRNNKKPVELTGTFDIDPKTGLLTTGLPSYQDYVRGFFLVKVEAYDDRNRKDVARVVIYILNQSQQLKFTFTALKDKVRMMIGPYTTELSKLTSSEISADERSISPATNDEAVVDFTKTDICFQMVRDHKILAFYDAEKTLKGETDPKIAALNKKYNMTNVGLCALNLKTYTWWGKVAFWWVLIAIALLLILIVLIMILVICCLWARYKNYLKRNVTYVVPASKVAVTKVTGTSTAAATTITSGAVSYEDVDINVKKDIEPSVATTTTTRTVVTTTTIPRTEL